MNSFVSSCMENLKSQDRDASYQAFLDIQSATNDKIDWAYEIWDELKRDLTHPDNHRRSIAAQLLCNLAISDPEGRMLTDFTALMEVTKDPRFVTARHCIQSLWKIGLAGGSHKEMLLNGVAERFADCAEEKNGTLIRFDLIEGLRKLYDAEQDEAVKQKALNLIETETDAKYRKKYASLWKKS